MISVYNESVICDCDGAKILRPQHFVVVCEHTSIHHRILFLCITVGEELLVGVVIGAVGIRVRVRVRDD